MTRIVAGIAGGRSLQVPAQGTRPTSERTREAVFSRLDHFGVVRDARVLDLFAGSGALGIEAASRGATHVTLVERSRTAAQICRDNARTVGLDAQITVVMDRAERVISQVPAQPWDLVLVDPPYDFTAEQVNQLLTALAEPHMLSGGAVVVVERSKRSKTPEWPAGWEELAAKVYGESAVWFAGPALAEDDAGEDDAGEDDAAEDIPAADAVEHKA